MSKKNILTILIATCIGTSASATEISFGSKTIAALSREDLLIDGVSTKYALGGTGFTFGAKITDKFAVSATYLKSYYPKYSTRYKGTRLTGDLTGHFSELSANYLLLNYNKLKLNLAASLGEGKQGSQSMSGTKNNTPVLASSESDIKKTDWSLLTNLNLSNGGIVGLGIGLTNWRIRAQGNSFVEVGGDIATIKKDVQTSSYDPFYDLTYTKAAANFDWKIGYRLSKLTSDIVTEADQVSLSVKFKF